MMKFTVPEAQHYAQAQQLEDWIHSYLTTGAWHNTGLSNGLKQQRRWWAGPLELPLNDLSRCTGPEPDMEFVMPRESWEQRVTRIQADLRDTLQMPPLIVEYRSGILSIRDGNHRHEAMCRMGLETCWALVWYNTRRDYTLHRLAHYLPNN